MFTDANTTHFTLFVDGLKKDQNANKPVDELNKKSNFSKPTGIVSNNNNSESDSLNAGLADSLSELTSSVTSGLSGIGSSLMGGLGGLTKSASSLDPFTTLQQANELKASLGTLSNKNNNSEEQDKPKSAVDRLQILSINGYEGISTLYAFEVVLVNEHIRFDITSLLSKPVFIAFTPDGKNGDGIHGVVNAVKRGSIGQHYATFSIVVTPRFTNLMRRTNQRKFVDKTTPEIIKVILEEHGMMEGAEGGYKTQFKETYPARDFCVQYDESDYKFVSRLCEEEGIAYSFRHSATNHTMVFTDANPYFPTVADAVKFMSDSGLVADSKVLKYFDVALATRPQNVSWRDYNFQTMKQPEGNSEGKLSEKANEAQEPKLEFYDYPSSGMDKARNEQLAKVQIERLRADHLVGEGYSDRSDFHAGYFITIEDHPDIETMDAKKPWLITHIRHKAYQPQVLEAFGSASSAQSTMPSQLSKFLDTDIELEFPVENQQQGYFNVFTAIPQEITFRPKHRHPKPQVLGSQTAVVTGAAGEEIYCDEYGRVKAQFHWDREGTMDENSSHWIRVASNWAHDGYGTVVIPRVGMEVKVDFLEGDPDNPIITGAIHNGVNKVPYDLPANKTRSVFKTSSSKGGVGSNELRIEDKAGQEQIFVQSQKDFDQLTKNNHTVQVNNNSHLQVNNEHSETIKGNRYQHQLAEEHHLTTLDRKTQVMMNDYKTVGISEHETIGTIKTVQAGMEIHLKSGLQTVIDGGLSLTLKAGGQHIVLNPAGIWMTMPVWTGGVPMEGTPSIPLPPLVKGNSVAATQSPPVILAQRQALLKGQPRCEICEKLAAERASQGNA
ncbi:type VI secretion system tip protein VgrG [Gammaproteobacteria bacterium ESL0073]|nr:type VI secretion system tip protein VgrG [Gammaproteobacteria bacterium ESL0073]